MSASRTHISKPFKGRPDLGKAATNYTPSSASDVTAVPVQTDFFSSWPSGWSGQITATWLLFFQQLAQAANPDLLWARLVLFNLAAGADIAPHVTAQASGTAQQVTAVLRKAISANLVVTVNQNGAPLITCTVNQTTKPDTVLTYSTFLTAGAIAANDVFSFAVVSSDGSTDTNGVASFCLTWQ